MTIKHNLLAGVAMTASERRVGRYLRAPEGHGEAAPAAAPAPTPEPASEPAPGTEEDFSAFEQNVDKGDDDLDPNVNDKASGKVDPATPGEGDGEGNNPPEPEAKGEPTVQERIDELTAARREAEREAAEERRLRQQERASYEERLGKLEKPAAADEGSSEDGRPDPKDYEFGEADGKYIADLSRHEARQEFQEQQRKATLETEYQQMETSWKENIAKPELAEKYPDFTEKVTKGADEGKWDLSPIGTILVKSSPVGADVAYHLASNPEESRAIAGMNFFEQAQALGRLEGRFLNTPAPEVKPAKITTEAPPPPKDRSRGAGGKFAVEADTDDFGAFDKMADGILN